MDTTSGNGDPNNQPISSATPPLKQLESVWRARVEKAETRTEEVLELRQKDKVAWIMKLKRIEGNLKADQVRIQEQHTKQVQRISQLEEVVVDERSAADGMRLTMSNLTATNTELVSKHAQLQSRNKTLTSENSRLLTENQSLNARVEGLTSTIQRLTTESERLALESSALLEDNACLTTDSERLASEGERLASEVRRLRLTRSFATSSAISGTHGSPDSAVGSLESLCSSSNCGGAQQKLRTPVDQNMARRPKDEVRSNTDPSKVAINEMLGEFSSDRRPVIPPRDENTEYAPAATRPSQGAPKPPSPSSKYQDQNPHIIVISEQTREVVRSYSNPDDPEEVFKKTAESPSNGDPTCTVILGDEEEAEAPPLPPRRKRSTSSPSAMHAEFASSRIVQASKKEQDFGLLGVHQVSHTNMTYCESMTPSATHPSVPVPIEHCTSPSLITCQNVPVPAANRNVSCQNVPVPAANRNVSAATSQNGSSCITVQNVPLLVIRHSMTTSDCKRQTDSQPIARRDFPSATSRQSSPSIHQSTMSSYVSPRSSPTLSAVASNNPFRSYSVRNVKVNDHFSPNSSPRSSPRHLSESVSTGVKSQDTSRIPTFVPASSNISPHPPALPPRQARASTSAIGRDYQSQNVAVSSEDSRHCPVVTYPWAADGNEEAVVDTDIRDAAKFFENTHV